MVVIFVENTTADTVTYSQTPNYAAYAPSQPTQQHYPVQQASQPESRVLAERYKTKMCRNFMTTGACPYHHRCMFAHGYHELRTTDMNVQDGLMTEEAIKSFQRAMTAYNRGELAQQQQQQQAYTTPTAPSASSCQCDECRTSAYAHNPYYGAVAEQPASVSSRSSEEGQW